MKTLMTVLLVLVFTSALSAQTLTKTERKEAVKYIKWSTKELKKSLKGLSEAQLSFNPPQTAGRHKIVCTISLFRKVPCVVPWIKR